MASERVSRLGLDNFQIEDLMVMRQVAAPCRKSIYEFWWRAANDGLNDTASLSSTNKRTRANDLEVITSSNINWAICEKFYIAWLNRELAKCSGILQELTTKFTNENM
jgi:hypothetical protein